MKHWILDLFFPPRCVFCGELTHPKDHCICPKCAKNLPFVESNQILRKIGKHTCVVSFYYEEMVRSGIHALKFQGCSNRAAYFAQYLASSIREHLNGEFDIITYVPISPLRKWRRGYDQSQLLAQSTAKLLGKPMQNSLRKIRNNPPQSLVKDFAQRQRNVQNVYRSIDPAEIKGRRFVLIDDVVTTGSTLTACADTLLAGGAASVVCAALAGGQSTEPKNSNSGYSNPF